MPSISHFIITRFNLRRTVGEGDMQLDMAWLSARLDLFDRFCFPTVRSQSVQDFRWLVLFDAQTPQPVLDRIREYQRWSNFVPIFFPAGSQQQARQAVLAHSDASCDLLMTTRLDNDDGLCRTFVEQVRRCAANIATPTLIEFPVGFVWHKDRIYLDRQVRNPFTTLVEPLAPGKGSDFRTIYGASHHEIGRNCRTVEATLLPSWMQVIHGGNVANHARGIRRPMTDLAATFDIEHRFLAERESPYLLHFDKARTTIRAAAGLAWHAARDRFHRSAAAF